MEDYRHGGAEAMVALHATHLRQFLRTWRRADSMGLTLPATSDPNYGSREDLLAHVMRCAAHYLVWICEQVDLPRPDLDCAPDPKGFGARADQYMEAVLAQWETPLRALTEEMVEPEVYVSSWGTPYSIDAMLEHAVMHPIRHTHQLERLMAEN